MADEPGTTEEPEKDREDELIELLNEVRVALPGVQVLFAFLLAVPFSQRFGRVSDFEQNAYFVSLLATMLGSVLLIAPSAYHRLRWRDASDEELLQISNRLVIAGTAFLAVGMTAAVFLITDILFGSLVTAIVLAFTVASFAWFWFGLPLWRKLRPPKLGRRYRT